MYEQNMSKKHKYAVRENRVRGMEEGGAGAAEGKRQVGVNNDTGDGGNNGWRKI